MNNEIVGIEVSPIYVPHLDTSRPMIGGNIIQTIPYQLDGSGILVGVWEATESSTGGNLVDWSTQNDLVGRVTIRDGGIKSNHATHVAGILGGDGTNNQSLKGIAIKVNLLSYDTASYLSEYSDMISRDGSLSQNSWGEFVNQSNCDKYGLYSADEEDLDDRVRGVTYGTPVSIIYSVGNERNDDDCNIPNNPYNTTTRPATAKNVVSVGAVYSDTKEITCFSSFGPTDDGRIKPDVMAPGDEANDNPSVSCAFGKRIRSTVIGNQYAEDAGTSMAAPHVSGTAALMYQQFDCLKPYNVETPLPSTIKALLIHTAKDINNTGPDYASGWGLINATEAIDYIIYRYFREDNISTGEMDKFNFTINDSSKAVKVTLVWDDVGGKDSDADHLKNDSDLYLKAPNGTIFKSWTLNPSNPSAPATKDGNHRDNVEQVYVPNPGSQNLYNNGQWQIIVNATSCPQCPQKYSLIYKRPFLLRLPLNFSLVSIPVMPYDTSIDNIVADNSNITRVYTMNATGFNWLVWQSDGADDITTIEPAKGYWFRCNGSTTLEINGEPSNVTFDFSAGWKTVGHSSFIEIPTNETLANYNFHRYTQFIAGRPLSDPNPFRIYYNNDTFENEEFNLKPGVGGQVYMKSSGTWKVSPTRSCPTVASTLETFSEEGAGTMDMPFVIYGYGVCDQELNKLNRNVTIHLRVDGKEIANYTMGDVAVNQYRLQVPIGAGVETNDTAEILINNVTIAEGNVTIGTSGEFYYLNITANETTDSDGDGFSCECLDCDDNNASIYPGATEVCNDGVDNDCDGEIDEGDVCVSNLTVSSLTNITINNTHMLFEFVINNTGSTTLDNINWTFDAGDGSSVIVSEDTFSLASGSTALVFIEYNYTTESIFIVNATANSGTLTASRNLSINLGNATNNLDVYDFSMYNVSSTHKIFQFMVKNIAENQNLTDISWSLNTGLGTINSIYTYNLTPNNFSFVFVEYRKIEDKFVIVLKENR